MLIAKSYICFACLEKAFAKIPLREFHCSTTHSHVYHSIFFTMVQNVYNMFNENIKFRLVLYGILTGSIHEAYSLWMTVFIFSPQ